MKTSAMKNDVSEVTLPAWPGQGFDDIVYLQDSYSHLYLVRSQTYSTLCMIQIFILYLYS